MSHREGCSTKYCVACSGADPTWVGKLKLPWIRTIKYLSTTDLQGFGYFRFDGVHEERVHDRDFPRINAILDGLRRF